MPEMTRAAPKHEKDERMPEMTKKTRTTIAATTRAAPKNTAQTTTTVCRGGDDAGGNFFPTTSLSRVHGSSMPFEPACMPPQPRI